MCKNKIQNPSLSHRFLRASFSALHVLYCTLPFMSRRVSTNASAAPCGRGAELPWRLLRQQTRGARDRYAPLIQQNLVSSVRDTKPNSWVCLLFSEAVEHSKADTTVERLLSPFRLHLPTDQGFLKRGLLRRIRITFQYATAPRSSEGSNSPGCLSIHLWSLPSSTMC